jgi:hypothetical protein
VHRGEPIRLKPSLPILSSRECTAAVNRYQQSEDVEIVTVEAIVFNRLFDVVAGHIKELKRGIYPVAVRRLPWFRCRGSPLSHYRVAVTQRILFVPCYAVGEIAVAARA